MGGALGKAPICRLTKTASDPRDCVAIDNRREVSRKVAYPENEGVFRKSISGKGKKVERLF